MKKFKILLLALSLLLYSTLSYGTSTIMVKSGVEYIISFPLFEVDGVDFKIDATDGGIDCSIRRDQGGTNTATNDFVDRGSTYSLTITAAEMDNIKQLTLDIIDQDTSKVFLDTMCVMDTYGSATAQHAFDLNTATQDVNVASIDSGAITAASIAADAITSAKIADNAIAAEHIAADAIGASELAADAIGASELATNAIGSAELAATAATKIVDDWETQSQADPTGFHVNVLEVAGTSQTANDNGADINTILTGTVTDAQGTNVATDVAAMIDANNRIDVGSWLGTAVTLGNSAPDVNVASEDNIDFGATKKTSLETAVDDAFDNVITASPTTGSRDDVLDRQEESIVNGSAATGTLSTTEMTTDLTITVNDQMNGRILTFRKDTTTAALRGQQTDIVDTVTTNGKLTFTALTTAPVNGDKFEIN